MKYEEMQLAQKTKPSVLPVIAAAVIFPVTVIFWGLNHYGGVVESGEGDWEDEGFSSGLYTYKVAHTDSEFKCGVYFVLFKLLCMYNFGKLYKNLFLKFQEDRRVDGLFQLPFLSF